MQAVQSSLIGHYSLSMSVSVAFHYIILKDSCLLPHKYVPLTSLGVTVINALLRIGCQVRCRGKSRLKWMKWSGSRRLNRSSCCLKDRGMAAIHLWGFKCFLRGSCFSSCHCDRKKHSRNISTIWPKGREKSLLFWQDVCFVKCCIVIQVHRTVWINCRHPPENRHSCWRCLQQGTICACWDKTEGMSIPPVGKYSSDQSIGCSVSRLFHHLLALSCSLWRVWTLVCWLREILPHPWKEHICLCLTR